MIVSRRSLFVRAASSLLVGSTIVRSTSLMKISPVEQPSFDLISIYGGKRADGWYIGDWVNVNGQARIIARYDGSTEEASLWPVLESHKKDRVQVQGKHPMVRHEDVIVPRMDFEEYKEEPK